MKLTIYFHVVLRLRMSGAIPALPLYAFMASFQIAIILIFVVFYKDFTTVPMIALKKTKATIEVTIVQLASSHIKQR
jgi:hypothetical protein